MKTNQELITELEIKIAEKENSNNNDLRDMLLVQNWKRSIAIIKQSDSTLDGIYKIEDCKESANVQN